MHPFELCRRGTPPVSADQTKIPTSARRSPRPRVDIFDAVNQAALPRFDALCREWLPGGKRQGSEWVVRNPTRGDRKPGSFKINMSTGRWADFATDARGGDPISLRAYLDGSSQIEAARLLAAELGVEA